MDRFFIESGGQLRSALSLFYKNSDIVIVVDLQLLLFMNYIIATNLFNGLAVIFAAVWDD